MDAFAPASAVQSLATVVDNVAIARDTYRLRLADATIARTIKPGQFVMIRPGSEGASDPLLGRPLALYDVIRDPITSTPTAFDVVYLVVGRGTAALSLRRPGERIAAWGPLGNGFGAPLAGSAIFVAGGIGQTPFLALGRSWLGRAAYGEESASLSQHPRASETGAPCSQAGAFCSAITLLYGVRTAALLAGVDDFRRAGLDVELATDDGSAGHHGYVTDILARKLERGDRPARVVGCGPPAMLATLAKIVRQYDVGCDVSLENQMACGFGACFSCVVPIRQPDGSTDLRRACVEGPIVSADLVDWPRLVH
jgi:dihydroorotate dehydrogenase electron transfer subunit